MSLNLSIKGVPESLAERLRARAERNHRSLQGELMAIIERAAATEETSVAATAAAAAATTAAAPPRRLVSERRGTRSIEEIAAEHLARYPKPFTHVPRAVDIIRKDRDSR